MRRRRVRLAAVALPFALAALVAGCSEPKTPPLSGPPVVGVHSAGWNDPESAEFHGRVLAARLYDFSECTECHGTGGTGGLAGVACVSCHVAPGGLQACTTCHGVFEEDGTDLIDSAPPRGLDHETDPLALPVGAHRRHLDRHPSRPSLDRCSECHTVPDAVDSPGHIDADLRAEVPLEGTLATVPSEGGARMPAGVWDPQAGTCSATYCHGNWALLESMSGEQYMYEADRMEGNATTPRWDDPSSGACGTCHGLPPIGHDDEDLDECHDCHGQVINEMGEIIDPSKHVDGMINLFDESYPMF